MKVVSLSLLGIFRFVQMKENLTLISQINQLIRFDSIQFDSICMCVYRYQEILTDPSYAGQFVLFTCPHIGNVGINPLDMESTKVHMGATIVRHESLNVSNYRYPKSR